MGFPLVEQLKSQPSWVVLLLSLGFLSLFKFSISFLKWVYISFLRPGKNLKNYGSWALVTGPTDGIGKDFAFQLARKGLNLVLVGRNPDKLKEVSDAIQAKYGKTQIKNKKSGIDVQGQMAIREKQYHDELKLELQGSTYSAALSNKDVQSSVEDTVVDASFPDPEQIVEDARNMSQVVMPRKKRKLYVLESQ